VRKSTGLKIGKARCQAKFLTWHHVLMHRVIFYISNTLIKHIIKAWEFVFGQVRLVRVRKIKILEVND